MSNEVRTRLLINAQQASDEIRFAIVRGSQLENFFSELPGSNQRKGNIYKGKVTRVEPGLQAAFVDIGYERQGFLPFKGVRLEDPAHSYDRSSISDVLRLNQEVMVQVEKEERGNKGAALKTQIGLAGSYLILMPNNPRAGGISRRIDGDERDELKDIFNNLNVPEDMGLIIRTAGVGKSLAELKWDLEILLRLWERVQDAYNSRPAPFLILQESDIIIRAVREYLRPDISEILVDSPEVYEKLRQHIAEVRPEFNDRLRLYQESVPLFTRFQVEAQIETAYQPEIRLPSGGYIVIQPTEALVSIDVNSSRDTKGEHIEHTAFNTNREAAIEVAKQMRLRDLGGLIVVDFIDMESTENQREIVNIFQNEIAVDKARVQYGRISKFGLLEISRQRLRPSLDEATQILCPHCNGQGTIRSVESLAVLVLRQAREQAMHKDAAEINVQAPVNVAAYLLNEKRTLISNIETQTNTRIYIIPNPHLDIPAYKIEKIREKDEQAGRKSSYHRIEIPTPDLSYKKASEQAGEEIPAVTASAPVRPVDLATTSERKSSGLLKKIRQFLFGTEEEKTERQSDYGTKKHKQARSYNKGRDNNRRRTPRKHSSRKNYQTQTGAEKAEAVHFKDETSSHDTPVSPQHHAPRKQHHKPKSDVVVDKPLVQSDVTVIEKTEITQPASVTSALVISPANENIPSVKEEQLIPETNIGPVPATSDWEPYQPGVLTPEEALERKKQRRAKQQSRQRHGHGLRGKQRPKKSLAEKTTSETVATESTNMQTPVQQSSNSETSVEEN